MTSSLHRIRIAAFLFALVSTLHAQDTGWPTYGGDPGGQRYTPATQITPANVTQLQPAWTYHTGDLTHEPGIRRMTTLEVTPILFHGTLYLSNAYDNIVALDPATGQQKWVFDSRLKVDPQNVLTTRGVAAWPLEAAPATATVAPGACSTRIFVATLDRRLLAADAATGKACEDFGDKGFVDLSIGIHYRAPDRYGVTSAPTVLGDVVVVGSLVPDNQRVDTESGLVRGYDVRSGKLLWSWEPLPWAQTQALRTGAGNTWSTIAADPEHGLVFLPTGAPSPDFYGGMRLGDNRDANSVVALEARTGRRVWGFQVVHHDVWDYDVASEPLLFTFRGPDGKQNVPAVAITTKQGLAFVLNRLTGEPLFPVDERPVPKSDVPGEQLSPTQPFQRIDSLSPIALDFSKPLGADANEDRACRAMLGRLRYEGIYTPPSLTGTLAFPGNLGGVNWGSASFDPRTGILYANTNRYAYSLTLVHHKSPWRTRLDDLLSRRKLVVLICACALAALILLLGMGFRRSLNPGAKAVAVCALVLVAGAGLIFVAQHQSAGKASKIRTAEHFGREIGPEEGTPYTILRLPMIIPETGDPCTPQPWGTVSALNLNTGKTVWQTPLGTVIKGQHTGTVNLGGSVLTGSGLLFTAASEEPLLRAFDSATGNELWQGKLPVPAQATPMSYEFNGRQYVVVAAGGHFLFGTPVSDTIMAFALPQK